MNIYPYPSEAAAERLSVIAGRGVAFDDALFTEVKTILNDVRSRGDAALIEYANRFDAPGLSAADIAATPEEFAAAEAAVDEAFMSALNRAAAQIEAFHRKQLRKSWIAMDRPGTLLGQLFNPVETAGIYVPGGTGGDTPLVSTVLMNAIPAKIAGVDRIVMVTPSRRDGTVHPCMLAAARRVGVDAVFKVGSAWAVGALAYGTESIPRCDIIVGPGNMYVTIAKKIVSGAVGIDMIAGPSEVLIIADDTADPAYTAADLLSQAEHDRLASAVLVTPSRALAEAVADHVRQQIEHLPRRDLARKSLERYGAAFVVKDLAAAFALANQIAPEHLELHIASPFEHLGNIRNAGAVFMGPYTPEPIGDYIAGPNHVLPTAGTARFSSALSVDNFIKKTSVLSYSETAFREEAPDVIRLAETEGLGAHAHSVRIRLEK